MSKKITREQKLKYIFAQNPNDKQLHVTSDDQAFRNKSDAVNHANTLKDREISQEKREDYVKQTAVKEQNTSAVDTKKERAVLFTRHEELFGQKPAKTAPSKKIKEKIEAEEARLAELAAKEQQFDAAKTNQGSDEEE